MYTQPSKYMNTACGWVENLKRAGERGNEKEKKKKTEEEERKNENRGRTFWKTNRKNPTSFGTAKTVNNNYIKAIKPLFDREREGGKPVYY